MSHHAERVPVSRDILPAGVRECVHGGFERDGACILDATHPAVRCRICGRWSCPCRSCQADHRDALGHEFTPDTRPTS